ncbi:hypothetical protein [Rubrobacter indicoceani]|nr:hypothetical protein [Rubrobacter indicoceani]
MLLLSLGIPLATFKPFLWFLLLIVGLWLAKHIIRIIYAIRNP